MCTHFSTSSLGQGSSRREQSKPALPLRLALGRLPLSALCWHLSLSLCPLLTPLQATDTLRGFTADPRHPLCDPLYVSLPCAPLHSTHCAVEPNKNAL